MTKNLRRLEAQARSNALELSNHVIVLDIREASSDTDEFAVTSQINLTVREEITTHIDFIGRQASLLIDGIPVPAKFDGARLYLPTLQPGQYELQVNGVGVYSTTGEGLHRFRDPVDNETYLYTQFEPADARRVFPNFEQPDLKARFAITIIAPDRWTILSNSIETERFQLGESSLGEPIARVDFASTPPLSTYLTAFIAGPYTGFHDQIELDDQTIDLGFYCRASMAKSLDVNDISTVTKQGLSVFPKAFGVPYMWGKYDSVFVPEYNLGAMENPGCVTFSERAYIHRGLSTRAERASRANTILHEMSHMWFGDYVTPVWWDDLWLKESFAEFMGAWASAKATQYTEAWVNFAGSRLAWALRTDQLPTSHPIVAEVPDLEAADQVFDGITYAKGAAVLRQLVAFVGEESFFTGVRTFMRTNPYGNAAMTDLLAALEESSGRDLNTWSQQWLHTSGVSTIEVERTVHGVRLTQTGYDQMTGEPILRPHRLRVTGFILNNDDVLTPVASTLVDVTDTVDIVWDNIGGAEVDLVLPNDEALSYIKIGFDARSLDNALRYDVADPLSRSVVSGALWQLVRDGELAVAEYVSFVARQPYLDDSNLLTQRTNTAIDAIIAFMPASTRTPLADAFFTQALRAHSGATPSSDHYTIWTRTLVSLGRLLPNRVDDLTAILRTTTDKKLRWSLLVTLAAHCAADTAMLDSELARTRSAFDVIAHLTATSSMADTRRQTLARLETERLTNDQVSALIKGFAHPAHIGEALRVLDNYFDRIGQWWMDFSQEIAERMVYGLYPFTDLEPGTAPEENTEVRSATNWLAHATDAPPALRKIILDQRDHHLRMLRNQIANAQRIE
ncbi:MAG: aminopeptidase N [Actinomycetaceae bacterium]|nr:aminopeptidase N [Actinomycetaceae bacterium]